MNDLSLLLFSVRFIFPFPYSLLPGRGPLATSHLQSGEIVFDARGHSPTTAPLPTEVSLRETCCRGVIEGDPRRAILERAANAPLGSAASRARMASSSPVHRGASPQPSGPVSGTTCGVVPCIPGGSAAPLPGAALALAPGGRGISTPPARAAASVHTLPTAHAGPGLGGAAAAMGGIGTAGSRGGGSPGAGPSLASRPGNLPFGRLGIKRVRSSDEEEVARDQSRDNFMNSKRYLSAVSKPKAPSLAFPGSWIPLRPGSSNPF